MSFNLRLVVVLWVLFAFLGQNIIVPDARAQELILPAPGTMISLSPAFNPPLLKGLKVHPDNPFRFDFILDQGDSALPTRGHVPLSRDVSPRSSSRTLAVARTLPTKSTAESESVPGKSPNDLKQEANKLIKYFLASLTIPEKDLWVNLSPYEKNRIIPDAFGKTEMGRDLLAEDYMLKQITSSLIYPEGETGKKFWKKVYAQAAKRFGTTNIPVNTFNKVWIVPEKAVVYENAKAGTAYVVESKLKVMLEEDYLSQAKHSDVGVLQNGDCPVNIVSQGTVPILRGSNIHMLGTQMIREIVIPELTKEVNTGANFAQLRQVYNSLILATWYKKKIKDSILTAVYANKNKIQGITITTPGVVEVIYRRYLQAFKKGVYNFIKEEPDSVSQQPVPRKYFSGGASLDQVENDLQATINPSILAVANTIKDPAVLVNVRFDAAMSIKEAAKVVRSLTDKDIKKFKRKRKKDIEGDDETLKAYRIKGVHVIRKTVGKRRRRRVAQLADLKRPSIVPMFVPSSGKVYYSLDLRPFDFQTLEEIVNGEWWTKHRRKQISTKVVKALQPKKGKWFDHGKLHDENLLLRLGKDRNIKGVQIIDFAKLKYLKRATKKRKTDNFNWEDQDLNISNRAVVENPRKAEQKRLSADLDPVPAAADARERILFKMRHGYLLDPEELAHLQFRSNMDFARWIYGRMHSNFDLMSQFDMFDREQAGSHGLHSQLIQHGDLPYGLKVIDDDADDSSVAKTAMGFVLSVQRAGGLVTPILLPADFDKDHEVLVRLVTPVTEDYVREEGEDFVGKFFALMESYWSRGIFDHDLEIDALGIMDGRLVVRNFGSTEVSMDDSFYQRPGNEAGAYRNTFNIAVDELQKTRDRLHAISPEISQYFQKTWETRYGKNLSLTFEDHWERSMRGNEEASTRADILRGIVKSFRPKRVQFYYVIPFVGGQFDAFIEQLVNERYVSVNAAMTAEAPPIIHYTHNRGEIEAAIGHWFHMGIKRRSLPTTFYIRKPQSASPAMDSEPSVDDSAMTAEDFLAMGPQQQEDWMSSLRPRSLWPYRMAWRKDNPKAARVVFAHVLKRSTFGLSGLVELLKTGDDPDALLEQDTVTLDQLKEWQGSLSKVLDLFQRQGRRRGAKFNCVRTAEDYVNNEVLRRENPPEVQVLAPLNGWITSEVPDIENLKKYIKSHFYFGEMETWAHLLKERHYGLRPTGLDPEEHQSRMTLVYTAVIGAMQLLLYRHFLEFEPRGTDKESINQKVNAGLRARGLDVPDSAMTAPALDILKEKRLDPVLKAEHNKTGGIDLTSVKVDAHHDADGQVIQFHIDPAQLKAFQDAPGFVPVILSIQPLVNIRAFLGLPA